MGRREAHAVFRWENLRKIYYVERLGLDVKIILKWILRMSFGRSWNRFIWLGLGTYGGLL